MPSLLGATAGGVSNGWTPAALPSLSLWLDASDSATITASGGSVSQWNDKSGAGNHVTQGTSSMQPTTGTTTLNGLNVVSFDGTDTMRTANGACNSAKITFFIVAKDDPGGNYQGALMGAPHAATSDTSPYFRWNTFRVSNRPYHWINGNATAGNDYNIDTSPQLRRFQSEPGTTHFNGVLKVSGNGTATVTYPNSVPVVIGSNPDVTIQQITGYVAEVIVCSATTSADDITTTETYLRTKWGF